MSELTIYQDQILAILGDWTKPGVMSARDIINAMPSDIRLKTGQLGGPLGGLRKRGLIRSKRIPVTPMQLQYVNFPIYKPSGVQFVTKPHYYRVDDLKRAFECIHLRKELATGVIRRFYACTLSEQHEILQGGKSHG